jgi:Las17-binding protein actin regulator
LEVDSDMTCTVRVVAALLLVIGLGGCSTAPKSQEGKGELVRLATAALRGWNSDIPGLEGFARLSYGYAMFPEIAKGALGVGAAYGRGVVYEQGEHIGYADLSYASLGLQAGGQAYQVLMVFENKGTLERFTRGRLDFSADASVVFLKTGYVANVRFIEGVTIFSKPIGGAMGGAAMGGQRFTFVFRDDREPGQRALPAGGTH